MENVRLIESIRYELRGLLNNGKRQPRTVSVSRQRAVIQSKYTVTPIHAERGLFSSISK
jgi:hypothetical protein